MRKQVRLSRQPSQRKTELTYPCTLLTVIKSTCEEPLC